MAVHGSSPPLDSVPPFLPTFWSRLACWLAAVAGFAGIIGWYWEIPELIRLFAGAAPMVANTGAGILAVSIGALALLSGRAGSALTAGWAVGIGAFLLLWQTLTLWESGLDEILVLHDLNLPMAAPGRMGPNDAIALLLLSVALGVQAVRASIPGKYLVSAMVAVGAMAVAFLALVGYITGLSAGYAWGRTTGMAPHAAAAYILLGSVLYTRSRREAEEERDPASRALPVFSAAGLLLILVGAVTYTSVTQVHTLQRRQETNLEVMSALDGLVREALRAESVSRAYVVMGGEHFHLEHEAAVHESIRHLNRLQTLLRGFSEESSDLRRLAALVDQNAAFNRWVMGQRREFGLAESAKEMETGAGVELMTEIGLVTGNVLRRERARHRDQIEVTESGLRQTQGIIVLGNILVGGLIVLALTLVLRSARRQAEAREALRISENRFRAAAEGSMDAFFILRSIGSREADGDDFEIVDANARVAGILGGSRKAVAGIRLRELPDSSLLREVKARMRRTVKSGLPLEEEISTLDEALRPEWHQVQAVPIDDGVAVVMRNITARKDAERKLRAFASRLQDRNKELQDFAYVASHDLQEPLRKIQAFGDRLASDLGGRLEDRHRDYLARMLNAAGRMQSLIEALLGYSRIGTSGQEIQDVDLNAAIRDVLSDLETRLEQTGGEVEVGTMPEIRANPVQIRQLFQNLIGNALKYHRSGVPPRVMVSARQVDPSEAIRLGFSGDRRYSEIEVRDNGVGFEEKYKERVFGVFQRLHGRDEFEGTGVGLAICRKIVERHGGAIWAESEPGRGARFLFVLPHEGPTSENPLDS